MSRRETPMTRWYWEQVGGSLIEEFIIVTRKQGAAGHAQRLLDGLIIRDGKREIITHDGGNTDITGKDVIVIQTKNSRLGMCLMGQTLFSMQLVMELHPCRVESIALCAKNDDKLRPMLEQYPGCKVVVCPEIVCSQLSNNRRK